MAATRLISLHKAKGKSVAISLSERLNYAHNPDKTEHGKLNSSYACNLNTVVEDFMNSKQAYIRNIRNEVKNEIIAYQIRQSFKPGEITPEEANKLGYELAMQFTKGKHAFTVSTHTDKAHIHNHIIFNSTSIDGKQKFKNFYYSGLAMQKLSDIICFTNGYSIIEKKPINEREKRTTFPKRHTRRKILHSFIDDILSKEPKDFENFLVLLENKGYSIKRGKHIALKGRGQKRFIRLSSLGNGYTEEDIKSRIIQQKSQTDIYFSKSIKSDIDLLINVEQKALEKGKGYIWWTKKYNLKATAKTLLFLQNVNVHSYKELEDKIENTKQNFSSLLKNIQDKTNQIKEIDVLKFHIFTYSKTKEIYITYKELKGDEKINFYQLHYEKIQKHQEAKKYFDTIFNNEQKLSTIRELNEKKEKLLQEIKQDKNQLEIFQKTYKDLIHAKENVDEILNPISSIDSKNQEDKEL